MPVPHLPSNASARLVADDLLDGLLSETVELRAAFAEGDLHAVVLSLAVVETRLRMLADVMDVDLAPFIEAVHAANMSKRVVDSVITKPKGWMPPPIAAILRAQGYDG